MKPKNRPAWEMRHKDPLPPLSNLEVTESGKLVIYEDDGKSWWYMYVVEPQLIECEGRIVWLVTDGL